jgi:hypothetical protein
MPAGPCSFPGNDGPAQDVGLLVREEQLGFDGGELRWYSPDNAGPLCMPRLPITTLGPWVDPFGLGQDGVGVVLGQKVASDLSRFPHIKASGCHHTNPNLGPNRCTRKVVHFPTSAFPGKNGSLTGAACGLRPSHKKLFHGYRV